MIKEHRIVLKNSGVINPASIDDYINAGGYRALTKALAGTPERVVEEVVASGLRGRGGAGFPTGIKKQAAAGSKASSGRIVVCNADEGEPGTFKDKAIMESDPHLLIEGMLIAAYGIGAATGYIYIRGEYYESISRLQTAIDQAYREGFLGSDIHGSGFSFDLEIKPGAGSYLCGEELTLLESLEGKRGYPRIKPPFPAEKGLWGRPTLVNNVETLANLPGIILNGSGTFRSVGTEKTPGTKIFTISGDVKKPGCYEVPAGVRLSELIDDLAGGTRDGKPWKTVLLGGAAGTFVPVSFSDASMCYEKLRELGATLGSGAVIVVGSNRKLIPLLQNILHFFRHESCGKCVPCRLGTTYIHKRSMELDSAGDDRRIELLSEMVEHARMMAKSSLCPLGQSPILPLETLRKHFSEAIATE
ncbi:MAG: SLBB domain-containing protein [Bacteroidales bacterium]|nr:SLBB domain-containing protein [Bacteroidales bacterium]